jgi:acetylornithine deacetylase
VVPAECHFVIDVRINDHYKNREVFDIIKQNTKSKIEARSFRLNSSSISINHPIVKAGIELGRNTYGSPTISDQALLSVPSIKLGPGKSFRSHSANEFIEISEIEEGINLYINIFNKIL